MVVPGPDLSLCFQWGAGVPGPVSVKLSESRVESSMGGVAREGDKSSLSPFCASTGWPVWHGWPLCPQTGSDSTALQV
jgi:hypothetical protein